MTGDPRLILGQALWEEMMRRGYRVEKSIENGIEVQRIYREDGSLCIVAHKPREGHEQPRKQ